jgi:hypothetical protein
MESSNLNTDLDFKHTISLYNRKVSILASQITTVSSYLPTQTPIADVTTLISKIDECIEANRLLLVDLVKKRKESITRANELKKSVLQHKKDLSMLEMEIKILKVKTDNTRNVRENNAIEVTEAILKKIDLHHHQDSIKSLWTILITIIHNGNTTQKSSIELTDHKNLGIEIETCNIDITSLKPMFNTLQVSFNQTKQRLKLLTPHKDYGFVDTICTLIDSFFKEIESNIIYEDSTSKITQISAQIIEKEAELKERSDQEYDELVHKSIEFRILKLNEIKEQIIQFSKDPVLPLPSYYITIDWAKLTIDPDIYKEPSLPKAQSDDKISMECDERNEKCCLIM